MHKDLKDGDFGNKSDRGFNSPKDFDISNPDLEEPKTPAPPINVSKEVEPDNSIEIDKNLQDESRDHILAVISYLWVFCLIPYLTIGMTDYVRYHAKQGLLLAIILTFWLFVWWILTYFLSFGEWIVWAINAIFAIFIIIGMLNAINGKKKSLPIIGGIAEGWR